MCDIRIERQQISLAAEWRRLRSRLGAEVGAVAAFVGLVRDVHGDEATALELEHYPGMTEKSIAAIVAKAEAHWRLTAVTVVHRVGQLQPSDEIVAVLTASRHRAEALAACTFVIDCLKTEAIFWKRESTAEAARWVQATGADQARVANWANQNTSPEA